MVDGLEEEFEGKARVVRVDFRSDAGRDLGRRFGIDVVPSFIVFDRSGKVVGTYEGTRGVPVEALRRHLRR